MPSASLLVVSLVVATVCALICAINLCIASVARADSRAPRFRFGRILALSLAAAIAFAAGLSLIDQGPPPSFPTKSIAWTAAATLVFDVALLLLALQERTQPRRWARVLRSLLLRSP